MKTLFLALEDFRSRDAGSRIRDWYMVEALASLGEVTVLCFSPGHTTDAHYDIEGVEFLIDEPTNTLAALGQAALRSTMYHVERYDFSRHAHVESVARRPFDLIVASQMYPMAHLDAVAGPPGSRPPVLWDTHNFDPDVWRIKTGVSSLPQKIFARIMEPRASRLVAASTDLADMVVACTEDDGSAWRNIAGDTPVAVAPNAADLEAWKACRRRPGDRDTFVLFGSLNQDSTSAGAMWFLSDVWPGYIEHRREVSLLVTGRSPGADLLDAAHSAGQVEVVANPVDLSSVVARGSTVVVPQVWGTGSKLKMAEALASGRRIVASEVATVGLTRPIAEFVDLADDPAAWHRLMDTAASGPRDETEINSLMELLSESMSWTASQNALITAVTDIVDR